MFEGLERGHGDSWLLPTSRGTERTGMAWSVVQVLAIVKCSTFRAIVRAPFLFSVFPAQLTAVIGAGQFALPFFFLNFLWASCNPCCWLDVWGIQCFVIFPHGRRSGRES